MSALFPAFLKLDGREVLLVGAGKVARSKLDGLLAAGARVRVVAPDVPLELEARVARVERRGFEARDVEGAWLVVAAATPEVNRAVAVAADARRVFVNAVDDAQAASAYSGGAVRKGGVTFAISTEGKAPALAGLLREALEALLPEDLGRWVEQAERLRPAWREARVPMEARRPLLLDALNALYESKPSTPLGLNGLPGLVSLVGAGPGDPELLTTKGLRRLREADLVLYDALVEPTVLALAPRAQRFFVGKRARRKSLRQETIHRLMIRASRRGKRVVRLKCGDPVVLGRGGEEALALAEANVPFELVPGVSSAIAAPELAHIPLTHRGLASGFLVLSGHAPEAFRSTLEAVEPHSVTLVVLMGVATRGAVAEQLLQRGWRANTPAALLFAASTPRARTVLTRLGSLASVEADQEVAGTLVIGDVVSIAERLGALVQPRREHAAGG
jgi:uroporphyrin-III C-methyltransferase/precorrin-2 dehydrogenase/sirohydrochlorin ferrochelatase